MPHACHCDDCFYSAIFRKDIFGGGGEGPSSVALSGKEKDDPQPTVTRVSILNNFAIRFKQLKLYGQFQHVTTLPLTVTLFIYDDEGSSFFLTSATFPIVID